MLLLSRIAAVIVLAVVVKCVYGYQRIVHINELFSDDEDFCSSGNKDLISGSGEINDLYIDDEDDSINLLCCVHGNCSCHSFADALGNLTSNLLLNITTNVTLTSVIHASNLVNVVIIGHNNPTVNCEGAGGIHFTSCHNCIIQGITWRGCGTDNDEPGLQLTNSSDITIQKCSFQHSRGQAVALLEISGHLNINNCKFANNSHYKGHGAIINILFSTVKNSLRSFKIHACNFSDNKGARNLIYINNKIFKHNINITISSSEFHHNQGVSVYTINQKLYFTGRILFQQNTAKDGAGIHISDHSTVVFDEDSNVTFLQNTADKNGGAIFSSNYSIVLFNKNSKVMFTSNKAEFGTVHSNANSNVIFKDSCKVIFYGNSARCKGTAVFSTYSNISFENSAYTEFTSNNNDAKNAFYSGGAIHAYYTHLSFEGSSMTKFSNHRAYNGGAINARGNSHVLFKDNSTTEFSNNSADDNGGAIFAISDSHVSFEDNSTTEFSNNRANNNSGAIGAYFNSHISFEDNSTTEFSNNRANNNSGAIGAYFNSHVSFEDNSTTEFSNNRANNSGAICAYFNSHVSFEDNSTTEFSNNRADFYGGAILAYEDSHVSFEDNSTTEFSNNRADDNGGAIFAVSDSHVSFEDNSTTEFSNNRADNDGGAIFAIFDSHVSFEDNSTTEFSNNRANSGGAIRAYFNSHVSFEDNSTTEFSNNRADDDGGAIIASDNSHALFKDNSTTEFSNNSADESGGAIFAISDSHVSFEDNSTTEFSNNRANNGGAIRAYFNSHVSFEDNSTTKFSNNRANYDSGAIRTTDSNVSFEDNSATEFSNNNANALSDIYAITLFAPAHIIFDGNSTVSFINDISTDGEIVYPISTSINPYSEHYYVTKLEIIAHGNFNITFNYQSVKWCTSTCLPYSGEKNYEIRIDNTGMVWCTHQDYFKCQSRNCQCKNLEDITANITNNSLITLSDKVRLSSAVNFSIIKNISIIGQNDLVVFCVNGGGLEVEFCNNLTIQGITWIGCNTALKIYNSKDVTIRRCSFLYSKWQAIEISEPSGNVNIDYCKFMHNNHYRGHGSAICYSSNNPSTDELAININNCDFRFNIGSKSIIYIKQSLEHILNHYINNSTFQNNQAISIYFSGHQNINFAGNLLFKNNEAEIGTGLYVSNHSTVTFGENSTIKFISNTADHYGAAIFLDNNSSVVFDKNSSVNFSDNYATNGTVYSKDSSVVLFKGICKVTFNSNKARLYGAAILSSENSQITFTGNSSVNFNNNIVPNHNQNSMLGGTIFIENYSLITFMERSITMFSNNTAAFGTGIFSFYNSTVNFRNQSKVFFDNNIVVHCGVLTTLYSYVSFNDNADVIYNANKLSCPSNSCFTPSAGAICSLQGTDVVLSGHSSVTFMNNNADHGSGAIVFSESTLTIQEHSTITFKNNIAKDSSGGALACYNSNITVKGNSNVAFSGNKATQSGGALHLYSISTILFTDNSTSTFINNIATINGGAILNLQSSEITFKGNSTVHFNYNKACNGGTFYSSNSSITFKEMSVTSFYHNKAKQNGGVGYFNLNSNVMFEGITVVSFNGNMAEENGGVLCSIESDILFQNNSYVSFTDNRALDGGAISADDNSYIASTEGSVLSFLRNEAIQNGGAFYVANSTKIVINEQSIITLNNNHARQNGGVIHSINGIFAFKGNSNVSLKYNEAILNGGAVCIIHSHVSFSEYTTISFQKNKANYGGAVLVNNLSSITVDGNSEIFFWNNEAKEGGAVYTLTMCKIIFRQNSISSFINNHAIYHGGAIFTRVSSDIMFMEKSEVIFKYNNAGENGGATYLNSSIMTFNEYSLVRFDNNGARSNGGVLYAFTSTVLFKGNSNTSFTNSKASLNGGALYFDSSSYVSFSNNASERFENNSASNGGAICLNSNSNITFKENSYALFKNNMANIDGGAISILTDSSFEVINAAVMKFITNSAHYGGAMHFDNNNYALFSENTVEIFENNSASFGGAICLNINSNITYKENSTVLFNNNIADIDGGALSIFTDSSFKVMDYAAIKFNTNRAKYGGAMYFDTTLSTLVEKNYKGKMEFISNTAKFAGENIYIDLTKSCNKNCLHMRIIMGHIKYASENFIATPPSKLVLGDPAVCIDDDTKIECNEYLLSHVMLGEEINVPATVLDYFNQSSYKAQFLLRTAFHQSYSISGSKEFLLSNGSLSGISITGNESLTKSLNYSANIILNDNRNFEWRQISVNLTIEMIPCYLGFWQYSGIQRCECYNASDIVSCSGSTSTIKRGYWFGSIKEKPTVTFCPINYCNFTCCETSNGYYHLSPLRDNQCRSHRTGPACGSCTDGYTLSFDSTECVDVDNCTAGQTVLVILLTVIYWISMFTLTFAIMYYKVGIGYLYSITYYYSIVDILLSQNIHASRGLYLTTTILSSFSKITPQFLGEFCLTIGMSGIDQQFIHYMHPSAVILILAIISLLARRSRRVSTIISRGIIHVICLLLLLSYTSIASTSLLLMKSLKFLDIDKVYTYPSPDIEYLHGRHLAYAIVAMLCTVSIVIGLPLLLTLEPFLNNKINFIKIKPLLDQFQGCYKDNFRYFAGYYMICRLIVIAIVIGNSSNDFVANYMLVIACGVIALVHVMVKPYNNETLNKFDGIILQLIIFNSILPWLDDFTSLTVL